MPVNVLWKPVNFFNKFLNVIFTEFTHTGIIHFAKHVNRFGFADGN